MYPDSSRIISATSVCFLELSKKSEFHLLKLLINLSNSKDNFVGSLSFSIANLAADINPIFFSLANSFKSCIDLSPKPRFGVFNILSKEWVIPKIKFINQFFNNDLFIDAWIEKISDFDISNYEKIIFSYHGLPDTQVDKVYNEGKCIDQNCDKEFNDINKFCYKAGCYETTRLISSKLNLNEDQYVTAFQSRLTKKWLTPFTDEVIEDYAKNNIKNILIIAPAFTTDNLETLIEIGDEYVELFNENGGHKLDFVSSLNDSDKWVDAIIDIMEK